MKKKRSSITPDTARRWAEMGHLFFIDALTQAAPMAIEGIAFHGGTNLHLSWGSPRHSEDLDFLVERTFGPRIRGLMPKIEKRMRILVQAVDPMMTVTITDRTRDADGLLNFRVVLSSPEIVGQVMVKAEFWQVDDEYMEHYEATMRRPGKPGDFMSRISQPIPAATMEAAFADKIVALGNRPYLKWRDLFDLWWIAGQADIDRTSILTRIAHQGTAYQNAETEAIALGLGRFLSLDPEAVFRQADPDLKRWLPKALWDALNPEGVRQIVDHARELASDIAQRLSPGLYPVSMGQAPSARVEEPEEPEYHAPHPSP